LFGISGNSTKKNSENIDDNIVEIAKQLQVNISSCNINILHRLSTPSKANPNPIICESDH